MLHRSSFSIYLIMVKPDFVGDQKNMLGFYIKFIIFQVHLSLFQIQMSTLFINGPLGYGGEWISKIIYILYINQWLEALPEVCYKGDWPYIFVAANTVYYMINIICTIW